MTSHAFNTERRGEVVVQLEGDEVKDLFVEVARGLTELVGTSTTDPPQGWDHEIVESVDQKALLVAWVNTLIERIQVDHLLYSEVEVDELSDTRISARIRGAPIAEQKTTVVEATMHESAISTTPEHASAKIVLEVR